MITGEQLWLICPNMKKERAILIADDMRSLLKFYKMNSYDVLHEFIANVAHESYDFRMKEESLNYSAKRLIQVWGKHFNESNAKEFAHNPQKLANKIYGTGSIARSLGNTKPEHGFMCRGSGFMQLTGYSNHKAYADFTGMSVEDAGKAMRESDITALDSAMWFFAVRAKLIPVAKGNSIVQVSTKINGGKIGLAHRKEIFERAKKILV